MWATIAIPARLESRRLPGKLLMADTGRPLILHTIEQARASRYAGNVEVVTDSEEIREAARDAAGVVKTSEPCWCGTQRIAKAVADQPARFGDIIVNLQADEPTIHPADLDALIERGSELGEGSIGTIVCKPPENETELMKPNLTKALLHGERALWFSRVPFRYNCWSHVGVYCWRKQDLLRWGDIAETWQAKREQLEQLAYLEQGRRIYCLRLKKPAPLSINNLADYELFAADYRQPDGPDLRV
jgi:3-deoxy-manno-octulosonate cytidylyltransferase (CMP-KDO synthetase)